MQVSCPTCQTQVIWEPQSTHRPFCSQRCKLIDLGEWASEGHRISSAVTTPGDPLDLEGLDPETAAEINDLLKLK